MRTDWESFFWGVATGAVATFLFLVLLCYLQPAP